ncbi:MAG: hypothetical protein ABFS56_33005 [Pseudomonadota bacterium]
MRCNWKNHEPIPQAQGLEKHLAEINSNAGYFFTITPAASPPPLIEAEARDEACV